MKHARKWFVLNGRLYHRDDLHRELTISLHTLAEMLRRPRK